MSSSSSSPPKRRRTRGDKRTSLNDSEETEDSPSAPDSIKKSQRSSNPYRSVVSKPIPTPYSTPFRSRNQSLCQPNVKDASVKKSVKKLKNLLQKQWYIFNVSPLFNMNYNEVCLKRYARRLREKLTARLANTESATEYEVSYALYPNLILNNVDHEAIEITISKISETKITSLAYNAVFLSWGADRRSQIENATFLPILICRGLKGIIKSVHEEFQLIHDCFISSFDIHDEDLRMLGVAILENSSFTDEDPIKLNFRLPLRKSGVLEISLPVCVLRKLLRSVHKSTSSQANVSEAAIFWTEVHVHTSRTFGIDLGQCHLLKVSFPGVAFNHDAIYAKKTDQMYLILCFLMSMNHSLVSVAPQVHEVVLSD